MTPFWVYFKYRAPGCVEASSEEDALKKACEFGEPISAELLPYPANPRLGSQSSCPSFCWQPQSCKGRSCCPRSISCVD